MTEREAFDVLKKIFGLIWKDDDRMEQTTLFELQDFVGESVIKAAGKEWGLELVEEFPWAFEAEYKQ